MTNLSYLCFKYHSKKHLFIPLVHQHFFKFIIISHLNYQANFHSISFFDQSFHHRFKKWINYFGLNFYLSFIVTLIFQLIPFLKYPWWNFLVGVKILFKLLPLLCLILCITQSTHYFLPHVLFEYDLNSLLSYFLKYHHFLLLFHLKQNFPKNLDLH